MNPLHLATALAVVLSGWIVNARATTVIPPTLDELVERSDAVIRSHVTATRCEWRGDGENRRIVTVVTFEVDEAIVGEPAKTLELEFLGGEIDGERMIVAGQTRFAPGHEDILFVSRQTSAVSPLVRMMFGRYLVVDADGAGREVVARANGTPLLAADQISAPLGEAPTPEVMAQILAADPYTPDRFADSIRECARRQGRTDVSAPSDKGAQQ